MNNNNVDYHQMERKQAGEGNIIFVHTSLYVMVLQVGKICVLDLPQKRRSRERQVQGRRHKNFQRGQRKKYQKIAKNTENSTIKPLPDGGGGKGQQKKDRKWQKRPKNYKKRPKNSTLKLLATTSFLYHI